MNLKTLFCASALALCAAASHADDLTLNVMLVANPAIPGSYSAGWGVTHMEAGAFTDTYNFLGSAGGVFDSSLVTLGFASADIDFTSVSVNGHAFNLTNVGGLDLATLSGQLLSNPIVLTVMGIAAPLLTAGTPTAASYAGTANIAGAVPEPESYAMLLAGLGAIGIVIRRRL